jgi:hypothetical protein
VRFSRREEGDFLYDQARTLSRARAPSGTVVAIAEPGRMQRTALCAAADPLSRDCSVARAHAARVPAASGVLKPQPRSPMRLRMAKIFGAVLMLAAIWYAATVFNGDASRDADATAETAYPQDATSPSSADAADGAASGAVTSRVRERAGSAVAEGYLRHTGE